MYAGIKGCQWPSGGSISFLLFLQLFELENPNEATHIRRQPHIPSMVSVLTNVWLHTFEEAYCKDQNCQKILRLWTVTAIKSMEVSSPLLFCEKVKPKSQKSPLPQDELSRVPTSPQRLSCFAIRTSTECAQGLRELGRPFGATRKEYQTGSKFMLPKLN